MSKYLVLATPRSFAKTDPAPIRLLEEHGCQVLRLPTDGGDLRQQLLEYLPRLTPSSPVWSPTTGPRWSWAKS